jgi:hypothetical protein
MRNGRRWLALDADLMFNPFTTRLDQRFGLAGIATWIAFLCACKRSPQPGVISYTTEVEGLVLLGLHHSRLVDNHGQPFTLEQFWTFTGREKQTRSTCKTSRRYVRATHWERWQKSLRREENTQRKAQKRRGHDGDTSVTSRARNGDAMVTEKEIEIDTPPTPPKGGEAANAASNDNGTFTPVGPAAVAALRAALQHQDEGEPW